LLSVLGVAGPLIIGGWTESWTKHPIAKKAYQLIYCDE